jgi:predicted enzyme related to lactoylglutathione lyase
MKLAYGIFYTNDIARISNFYQSVMQWKKAFGDERFIAFQVGDALLGIKKTELEREVPGHQTIIIEVPDVEATYTFCKQHDVTIFKELSTESWGKNFSLLDPDGNRIEFVQRSI